MDLGLKGKKAIITGGSKGIGLATAHVLADEGVDVAICSRKIDDVNAALEALKGKGVNAIGGVADVADGDSFKAWMASTIEELGGLDILVPQVSAGGGDPSEKGWEANFQTDIMGTVRAVESSIEALRASSGSIVMISTTTAIEEGPGSGPYGAVKAGLLNVIGTGGSLAKITYPPIQKTKTLREMGIPADVGVTREVSESGSSPAQTIVVPPIRFAPMIEFTAAINDALDGQPTPFSCG